MVGAASRHRPGGRPVAAGLVASGRLARASAAGRPADGAHRARRGARDRRGVARGRPTVGALGLVLVATLCDALDGAVAILARRASPSGAFADKVADRVADTAFALVIWRCGAPLWLAVVAGALSLAHEALREVRGGALRARITVAERPTRVDLHRAGLRRARALVDATWPPTVCAAVWVGLAAIGLAQLAHEIALDAPLVVLVGASGSGKSTWAAERYRRSEIVSSDDAAGDRRQRRARSRRDRRRVRRARFDRGRPAAASPDDGGRHARHRRRLGARHWRSLARDAGAAGDA